MTARPFRAAALVALTFAALGATACVRGRNDGGKDAAGGANNGAGPAAQPGDLAGQSRDTTMIAPVASAPAGGAAGAPGTASGGAATTPAAPATKKAP